MKASHCWHQLYSLIPEAVIECCRCGVESYPISAHVIDDNCEADYVVEEG